MFFKDLGEECFRNWEGIIRVLREGVGWVRLRNSKRL